MRQRAQIVTIDPAVPERAFSLCGDVITSGGVIAYPTDTFYALGVDPGNPAAIKRIFDIKGRMRDQPLLLLISGPNEATAWAREITPPAEALMQRYWPGPLTLIFAARHEVNTGLTAGTGTIGLRVPDNALARGLLRFIGHALTGTSANISGRPSPRTAEEALHEIGDRVDLVLDGGLTPGGKPSTLVDVSSGEIRIIREGAIPGQEIMKTA